MSVKLTIKGIAVEVDSVTDAAALITQFGEQATRKQPQTFGEAVAAVLQKSNGKPSFQEFVELLNDNGKAVMKALVKGFPATITTDELAHESGINSLSLPPIFKHIKSAAARAHIAPDSVFTRKQVLIDNRVKSAYLVPKEVAEGVSLWLK